MNDVNDQSETVSDKAADPSLSTYDAGSTRMNEKSINLHREKLVVRKKEMDAGIILRKVVRSKTVTVSVELLFEELVIHESRTDRTGVENSDMPKDELIIPLYREEFVIEKKIVLAEEVHVGKRSFTEKKAYSTSLLSEDIERLIPQTPEITDVVP